MRFQSDSRNDHKRGVKAEANPMTLCFTSRIAFLCFNVLSDPKEVSLIRRSLKKFFLASILMQHLTLLTRKSKVYFTCSTSDSFFITLPCKFFSVSGKTLICHQGQSATIWTTKVSFAGKKLQIFQGKEKSSFSVCDKMQKVKK